MVALLQSITDWGWDVQALCQSRARVVYKVHHMCKSVGVHALCGRVHGSRPFKKNVEAAV